MSLKKTKEREIKTLFIVHLPRDNREAQGLDMCGPETSVWNSKVTQMWDMCAQYRQIILKQLSFIVLFQILMFS